MKIFTLAGKPDEDVALPGLGTVGGFSGKRAGRGEPLPFSYTSFTTPGIHRYDLPTGQSTIFRQPQLDFDAAAYETKQVFYASKDDTRDPCSWFTNAG